MCQIRVEQEHRVFRTLKMCFPVLSESVSRCKYKMRSTYRGDQISKPVCTLLYLFADSL